MKLCKSCGIAKELGAFSLYTRDGICPHCKACRNARNRRRYYSDLHHYQAVGRHHQAQTRKRHPERHTAEARHAMRQREYRRHGEKIRAAARQWRKTHPGATTKQVHAWAAKYPDRYRIYNVNHAAQRRGTLKATLTAAALQQLLDSQHGRCFYCAQLLNDVYHIDHKTPLSRGGEHCLENICLACPPCNLRKNRKTVEEFKIA